MTENQPLQGSVSTAPEMEQQRRHARIHLQIPMFVRGTDSHGEEFLELAKTLDVSASGVLLASSRQLRVHDLVTLTIPAPPVSASGLMPSGMMPITARVRRQQKTDDVHLIGLEFLKPLD